MRYQAQNPQPTDVVPSAPQEVVLPISETNSQLAQQIKDGTASIGVTQLERCSAIYPNGEFAWTKPTMGVGAGGAAKCAAAIEMRAIGAGPNGEDGVLARGYLGAGDSIVCNISQWPEYTLMPAAGEIVFPADAEPTMEDVVQVLNQEQKQNAALKIAAGTVLFGLGGNMMGKNEPGKTGLIGGGKDKTTKSVVGALGGAAIMAGNVYGGKVAGDVILSTGVNAAAGAVMGNMVASGDDVLQIEPCTVDGMEQQCLWGYIEKSSAIEAGAVAYVSANDPDAFQICKKNKENKFECNRADLNTDGATVSTQYDTQQNRTITKKMTLQDMFQQDKFALADDADKVCINNSIIDDKIPVSECTNIYIKLTGSVSKISSRIPAMAVGVTDKGMGWKRDNWTNFVSMHKYSKIVSRSGNGIAGNLPEELRKRDDESGIDPLLGDTPAFKPAYRKASDGGVIDMSNKARMKSTLTGAGVGGGVGAFVGYQGAQQDIEERWLAAVREYKDSLGKIYCITGTRFLSQYNDPVYIPNSEE